jgi:hypothetical protein
MEAYSILSAFTIPLASSNFDMSVLTFPKKDCSNYQDNFI